MSSALLLSYASPAVKTLTLFSYITIIGPVIAIFSTVFAVIDASQVILVATFIDCDDDVDDGNDDGVLDEIGEDDSDDDISEDSDEDQKEDESVQQENNSGNLLQTTRYGRTCRTWRGRARAVDFS